jgi:Ca2+-binding RTX toxin-like protein
VAPGAPSAFRLPPGEPGSDPAPRAEGWLGATGGAGRDQLVGGPDFDVLRGKGGKDRLTSRGDGRDLVRCGKGFDRAKADPRDTLRGCEKMKRC